MNNEITKIKISNDVNTSGTSFRGNVLTTYDSIFSILGEPTQKNLDKVNVEWDIRCIKRSIQNEANSH